MPNLSWCAKVTVSTSCQHPPLLLHHCLLPPDRIRALTPAQNMKYVQCQCYCGDGSEHEVTRFSAMMKLTISHLCMGHDRENGSAQLHSAVPPRNLGWAREQDTGLCTVVLWSLVRRRVNIGKYKQDYCQGGDNIKCWDLFKYHIEYSDIICNVIKMEFGMDLGKVNLVKLIFLNIYNWNNWYGYYQLRIQHFLDFSFSGLQELAIDII